MSLCSFQAHCWQKCIIDAEISLLFSPQTFLQTFISPTSPSIHFHCKAWPWVSHNSIFTACLSKKPLIYSSGSSSQLCCKSPHLSISIILSWPSRAAAQLEMMHQSQQMFDLHCLPTTFLKFFKVCSQSTPMLTCREPAQ